MLRLLALTVLFCLSALAHASQADEIRPEHQRFFEEKIRPVLVRECYACHSNRTGNARGGLRLDNPALTAIGGSSGPAVVAGDLEASLLFSAIAYQDFQMPPDRQLDPEIIEDFRTWIEMGAPDPRGQDIAEIKSSITGADIAQAKNDHWAYRALLAPHPPQPQDASWAASDIDRFILAKLESAGMQPAGDASAEAVLRRLTFDLVGLPPLPEQQRTFYQAWKAEPAAAVAQIVDQLLASERFGERWGRHWLDVARYGESTGREVNLTYPHAWRFRDYVIDAFNADKPINEFVQEQIAGDLLPAESDQEWTEHLIATGFLAIGPKNVNEQNRVQFAADVVDEQIDAVSRGFLGISIACARCHDHKFDAIPQSDYYALAGIFQNMTTYFGNPPSEYGMFAPAQVRRTSSLLRLPVADPNFFDASYSPSELQQLRDAIEQEMASSRTRRDTAGDATAAIRQRLATLNRLFELNAKLAVVDADGHPRSYCMGVQENDRITDARLLVRGEIDQAAQTVPRGIPQVLTSEPLMVVRDSSGRLELARWIGSDHNPLTARVFVNRVWHHLAGQGIVTSTEDFGVTGSAPSHPELLDHLATRFIDSGWSLKQLVREIATSRFYRMQSRFHAEYQALDPENTLLWSAHCKPIDAESLRDAMLVASGELDLQRPRASVVAEAGYTRVRNGMLGDPREALRKAAVEAMREARLNSLRGSPFGRRPAGPLFRSGQENTPRAETMANSIAERVQSQLDLPDARYRSVYLPVVRNEIPRSLDVFDFADSNSIVGSRAATHTPNQALYLLNNPFVIERSEAFAWRLSQATSNPRRQIELAYQIAFSRTPSESEIEMHREFARSFSQPSGIARGRRGIDQSTLALLCQSLFASAEFRLLD